MAVTEEDEAPGSMSKIVAAMATQDLTQLLTHHPKWRQATARIRMPSVSRPSYASRRWTDSRVDGGYQNYVALWYQSLMYQQQQQGGQAPAGAPAPGAQ